MRSDDEAAAVGEAKRLVLELVRDRAAPRQCWGGILYQAVVLFERAGPPVFSLADTEALLARSHATLSTGGTAPTSASTQEPRMQVVQLVLVRAVAAAFLHEADATTPSRGGFCVY